VTATSPAPVAPAWLRLLLSLLSGVALALSFPDASVTVLAFFSLMPLILVVVHSPGWWGAFWGGWIALTLTWLINVPWVVTVMWEQGGLSLPAGIAIFVAMSAILGLYGSLFAVMVYWLRLGRNPLPWLLIPFCWITVEYARTHLLTGFSWNLLAVSLIDHPFVQLAPWIGPYGLGGMILVPSVAGAWLVMVRPRLKGVIAAIAAVGGFLIVWGVAGLVLLEREEEEMAREPRLAVAAVQPDIPLTVRWDPQQTLDIYRRMQEMTIDAIAADAVVVVWPESTVPLTYFTTDFYRDWIEAVSAAHDLDIILGSVAEDPREPENVWNSAYLVHRGETIARYDKIKLVPFGEYVPLRKMLFFAEKLVRAVGTFQFGTNEDPLRGRFSYGSAICYEVTFPQIVSAQVRNGATVLVTITNDAWFGDSSAPRQHLDAARLRAVESRRWMIRSATTGISAIVDPAGRLTASQPLDTAGILVEEIGSRAGLTPYLKWGDWLAIASVVLSFIAIASRAGLLVELRRRWK
jgi:apolipoprotein N-acyltransferase